MSHEDVRFLEACVLAVAIMGAWASLIWAVVQAFGRKK